MARRILLVCALLALYAPSAWAHAFLVSSDPPDGSVLAEAPTVVTVTFSTSVRVGTRNAVIRNADGASVLAGDPTVRRSRMLVLPLAKNLADGAYTARWSIVSDDGHREEGVIAFGVGEGSTPVAVLGTRGSLTWQQVVMRSVFLLGVLGCVGSAAFAIGVLRPLGAGRDLMRRHAHLLFAFFVLAFAGADALIHDTVGTATRFERVLDVAAVTAVAGAAAAALAPLWAPLLPVAWAAVAVLVACPSLSGHALDADQPVVLAPIADLLHVGAAGVWLGCLASLLVVVGRAPEATRRAAAVRYSAIAGPAVAVLATAGVSRALTELASVSQLWSTGYGRAILVKSALLATLVGLAWLGRRRLAGSFDGLRRIVALELVLLLGVVVAVGTLTVLPPGSARPAPPKPSPPAPPVQEPPPPPPPGAWVDGAQAGRLAVGFAYVDGTATVTLTAPDGSGATGVPVSIAGLAPNPCGRGCFSALVSSRSVAVRVGDTRLLFDVPSTPRRATARLAALRRGYEASSSLVIRERLASSPSSVQVTVFREHAPDRMAYRIVSASNRSLVGTEGVVIGDRRWDRLPGGAWVESAQSALRVPLAYWTTKARNAFVAAPGEITFYDPTFPAWFRLAYDERTGRVTRLHMVASAHFMSHAYSGFDRPLSISPPR